MPRPNYRKLCRNVVFWLVAAMFVSGLTLLAMLFVIERIINR